jgi:hypothetical protein
MLLGCWDTAREEVIRSGGISPVVSSSFCSASSSRFLDDSEEITEVLVELFATLESALAIV